MILLDTHVWVKWVSGDPTLPLAFRRSLAGFVNAGEELGVSVMSCWEVALLVERGRLAPGAPTLEWIESALAAPRVRLIDLTPGIAVASTQLPGEFHRDPADRVLVATARAFDCEIITADANILAYEHVRKVRLA